MKFVFHRERTIASTLGHVIHFPKGELVHVPSELYKEILAAGGVPEDEAEIQRLEDEAQKPKTVEPVDPVERMGLITLAMEDMVQANIRDEFTANGQPHLRALKKRLGWTVTDAERDSAWATLSGADGV